MVKKMLHGSRSARFALFVQQRRGERAIATVLVPFGCCDAVIADADPNDSPLLSLSARSCADSWGDAHFLSVTLTFIIGVVRFEFATGAKSAKSKVGADLFRMIYLSRRRITGLRWSYWPSQPVAGACGSHSS